jgi:NADPH-dependent 7-cyano-7-deazaguanine reductase QueF
MTAAVALPALKAVAASPACRVTVKGELNHRCPFADEADYGDVAITWTTTAVTVELHSLRAWLDTWTRIAISHEALIQAVASAVAELGVANVSVEATYETAGMEVTVSAVPHPANELGRGA